MKKFYHLIPAFLLIFGLNLYAQSSSLVQAILNQSNSDSLLYFVKELSGNVPTTIGGAPYTILSRNSYQPGNDKAMQYIQERLQSYGLTTTIQTFSGTGKNVYAVQPGTQYPNKKYMICAHFDDEPGGAVAPGADDNASGTAAVLEAARIFHNYSFPYTIVYALWDEEEQGLVGSAYYANQAALAGDSIMGVINLDMIAYDSNDDGKCEIHTRNIGSSLQLSAKMVECNTAYGINLATVIKTPGLTASDHASFWDEGYGAILLIEDYSGNFNAYYHTTNDLITHFNIPYFFKSAKLAYATLASFVLDLNMQIQHTPIASGNYPGNIQTSAFIQTGLPIGTGTAGPRLYYRTSTGGAYSPFYEIAGTPAESGNFNFTIPALALGTKVQYYLAAQDSASSLVVTLPSGGQGYNPPGNIPPSSFLEFYVAVTEVVFADSAMNLSGWSSTGGWNITTSKFVSPPNSFTDSPAGNYSVNANAALTLNTNLPLSNALGAVLEFSAQWDIETDWDYGQVLISTNNGSTWTPLQGQYTNAGTGSFQPNGEPLYDGTQSTWVREHIDISNYIGQNIKLRFWLRADSYVQEDGWYVDDILITAYSAVPVELTTFTAEPLVNGVQLNWATASETNNKGFEVQRSTDKEIWNVVKFIEGAGTSTLTNYYTYFDKYNGQGILYYRLKQIDYDGTSKIYGMIEADLNKILTYSLSQNYPNPFNPSTRINYSIPEEGIVSIILYDVLGNEIQTIVNEHQQAGRYEIEFNASNLSSGVYFYQIKSGTYSEIKKMMLMR